MTARTASIAIAAVSAARSTTVQDQVLPRVLATGRPTSMRVDAMRMIAEHRTVDSRAIRRESQTPRTLALVT